MNQRQQQQVAHMMQSQGQGQGQFGAGYGQPHQPRSKMQQNSSDASMGSISQKQSASSGPNANAATPAVHLASVNDPAVQANIAQLSAVDDDVVPTVFRWEHGGRDVYITGTFNNWTKQIPMHRSGNDFTYIHNLKRGKHAFKFIVDDEWRYAPDQPTVADIEGRINNFIDVTDFKAYTGDKSFETERNAAYYANNGKIQSHNHMNDANMAMSEDEMPMASDAAAQLLDLDGETFTHNMPDLDEYTKDPPPLPPHLRHIILNKPPQLQDTAALPVPQHVALNHLYCTAIRDNMMVLGITQRYQTKFVTTVYYSPELNRT
jgi:5'-AMP-activated protein kinase regulatory beta subunit